MSGKNKITHLSRRTMAALRPGLVKTNLSYNDEMMMCHFKMKQGSKLALHNHPAAQNGFVISGSLRYEIADADKNLLEAGILTAGSGYVWDAMEYHSTEALEDAEFVECFHPMRGEYAMEDEREENQPCR